MSELFLVYFDETGTERESVPFQGRWSSLAEGVEHAQNVLTMREGREIWGYEVHGALVWDNTAQREAWQGTREGSTIGDQRWSDWGGYATRS
jgi:hypothetical protein